MEKTEKGFVLALLFRGRWATYLYLEGYGGEVCFKEKLNGATIFESKDEIKYVKLPKLEEEEEYITIPVERTIQKTGDIEDYEP